MSKKNPKYYRVKTYGELRKYRFEELEHGGEIGILKYDVIFFPESVLGHVRKVNQILGIALQFST